MCIPLQDGVIYNWICISKAFVFNHQWQHDRTTQVTQPTNTVYKVVFVLFEELFNMTVFLTYKVWSPYNHIPKALATGCTHIATYLFPFRICSWCLLFAGEVLLPRNRKKVHNSTMLSPNETNYHSILLLRAAVQT